MGRFGAKPDIAKNHLVLDLDPSKPGSIHTQLPSTVQVLVVAGGGGGGSDDAGGGGAGGLITETTTLTDASYSITVGAGGSPGTQAGTGASGGSQGGNSVAFGLTAIGGGYGATQGVNGGSGGSGGGGGHSNSSSPTSGGNGTSLQGGKGGGGRFYTYPWPAGGGGGASQNGVDGLNGTPGDGGDGIDFSTFLSGLSLGDNGWFAGGGGGGYKPGGTISLGGNGGGGNGGNDQSENGSIIPTSGDVNTGGGGGGGGQARGDSAYQGKAGGSGIVIVRYPGLQAATGGTIYYQNGATYHVFTSSGTFTPHPLKDVSGHNNHATLENGAIHDVNGGYIELDGVNDRISIPNTNGDFTIGTSDFTLACWVYAEYDGTYPHIFAIENQYNFSLKAVRPDSATEPLRFYVYQGYSVNFSNTSLKLDEWQHITLVRSGQTHTMYINGVETDSVVDSSGPKNIAGGTAYVGWGWSTEYVPQKRGRTQLFNRALTSGEVIKNYNITVPRRNTRVVKSEGLGSVSNPASNAQQLHDAGITTNGVYHIDTGTRVVPTYCEFKNGEGWMLVMNIKSDYFGDSKLTWNDYNNWINAGENIGYASNPFRAKGQYRNSSIFNNQEHEKWMIKIHNYGKEYGNGSWAAWELLNPGDTFINIMNTPGTSGGGTQVTDSYYAMEGLGNEGYANGLFWCPISRTLDHLRVNHLLNNNAVRILGNRNQLLETSNTDRTRGIGCNYAIAGTALTNTHMDWNAHISPHCANPLVSPFAAGLRQFTEKQFPDGSNSNTATQGEVVLPNGIYPHYGIFIK